MGINWYCVRRERGLVQEILHALVCNGAVVGTTSDSADLRLVIIGLALIFVYRQLHCLCWCGLSVGVAVNHVIGRGAQEHKEQLIISLIDFVTMKSAAAPPCAFWCASTRPASAFCCYHYHHSRAQCSSNRQVQAASIRSADGRGQVLLGVLAPWARAASLGLRPKQLLQRGRLDADAATKLLLACSVLPAALLAVQPLWTGPANNSLAWQGTLRDMFSFTVLLGVFITCEPAAATASAVSAAGGALALVSDSIHGCLQAWLASACKHRRGIAFLAAMHTLRCHTGVLASRVASMRHSHGVVAGISSCSHAVGSQCCAPHRVSVTTRAASAGP